MSADVAIVGGGTVGLFLAKQLVDRGLSVVVIEAGGRVPSSAWNESDAQSVGREHDGTKLGRAAGLGGTSSLWGGQLAEFDPYDFDPRTADWGGITAAELAKYYQRTYSALGIPAHPGSEFAREVFGAESQALDAVLERVFTAWLPVPNFAALFSKSIVHDKRLRCLLGATVNSMEFDGEHARRAQASCNGARIEVTAKNYVFAAGTLGISRFFLHMQHAPGCPWAGNNRIGKNFQDHLGGRVARAHLIDEKKFRAYFENGWVSGVKLQPKLRYAPEARAAVQSGVSGYFVFDSEIGSSMDNIKALLRSLRAGVLHSSWRRLPSDIATLGPSLLRLAWRFARDRRVLAVFDRGVNFHIQSEQLKNEESYIKLSSTDLREDGLPQISVNWHVAGTELSSIRKFTTDACEYLARQKLAKLEIDEGLSKTPELFISGLRDTYHQCGGMCIGSTAATSVVDSNCRVWGTGNVYVAGAAVFPAASHANPTLTALALSLRLADGISASP